MKRDESALMARAFLLTFERQMRALPRNRGWHGQAIARVGVFGVRTNRDRLAVLLDGHRRAGAHGQAVASASFRDEKPPARRLDRATPRTGILIRVT